MFGDFLFEGSFFLTASQTMDSSDFDATATLAQLRQNAAVHRKSVYHPSRLDRFAFQLHQLLAAGAKPVELQRWLRQQRCKVALSTVTRWISRHGR